ELGIEALRHVDVAAHQRRDAGAAALERYAQEFGAGIRLDLLDDVFPHAARHRGDPDGAGLLLGGLHDLLDRHALVGTFGRADPDQRVGVDVGDGFEVGVFPASLRAQHGVAPYQVGERTGCVTVGLGLRGQIGMAHHAGAAGTVVDDDAVAAPLLDMLG